VKFLADRGILKGTMPIDRVLTNDFIADINRYDREAVVASAKTDGADNSK
jgi:hypothetical protein